MQKRIFGMIITLFVLTSCGVKELPDDKTEDGMRHSAGAADESWVLIAEGEYLNLYHINEGKSLKNSELIDISVFPMSDAAELKKGIKFDTISDAYTVMEGFIN